MKEVHHGQAKAKFKNVIHPRTVPSPSHFFPFPVFTFIRLSLVPLFPFPSISSLFFPSFPYPFVFFTLSSDFSSPLFFFSCHFIHPPFLVFPFPSTFFLSSFYPLSSLPPFPSLPFTFSFYSPSASFPYRLSSPPSLNLCVISVMGRECFSRLLIGIGSCLF